MAKRNLPPPQESVQAPISPQRTIPAVHGFQGPVHAPTPFPTMAKGTPPGVTVMDIRRDEILLTGGILGHLLNEECLILNLDTGYQITINLKSFEEALNEMVISGVIKRLKGE